MTTPFDAEAYVDARIAAAVADAPPLPDDVRLRIRGLITASQGHVHAPHQPALRAA